MSQDTGANAPQTFDVDGDIARIEIERVPENPLLQKLNTIAEQYINLVQQVKTSNRNVQTLLGQLNRMLDLQERQEQQIDKLINFLKPLDDLGEPPDN